MPAPTIEAIPVAVRPTRPMLRTNLALAKAGAGPEHPADAQRKDTFRPPAAPAARRDRPRHGRTARPHPGADRLPEAGAVGHRARGADLVAGREAPGLPLERPGAARAPGLGGGPRRERSPAGDGAADAGRGLGGGVASRTAAALPGGRGGPAHRRGRREGGGALSGARRAERALGLARRAD